jgi:hypothetical protein
MTTEAHRLPPPAGMALALLAWFGVMAVAAFAVEMPALVAFGPAKAITGAAASHGSLVSAGSSFVVLRPSEPDAVRALYRGGAWLVLPAPGKGCGGAA